jgi:hypothetical protein
LLGQFLVGAEVTVMLLETAETGRVTAGTIWSSPARKGICGEVKVLIPGAVIVSV